jgi:hypothetical protein
MAKGRSLPLRRKWAKTDEHNLLEF